MADVMVKHLPAADPKVMRTQMLTAAAKALSQFDPVTVVRMCGDTPAHFVQTCRPIFKQNGFTFSDNDIREIQERLRIYVRAHPELIKAAQEGEDALKVSLQ